MHPPDDTIVAIASPPGGAARGIVRLSGPEVSQIIEVYFESEPGEPHPWGHAHACVGMPADDSAMKTKNRARATAGLLRLPRLASPLPCDVYLWPNGRSYTGQPVAEIHTIGSPPLLEAVVRAMSEAGARLAEPGEFTLRAFLAGRIDLSQAEAVLGVIDAEDPARLRVALAQLAGGLAGPLGRLRDELVDILAEIEAGLDFADEDLPPADRDELGSRLARAAETVAELGRRMASRGETGPMVTAVLLGRPNAGKSSLFNALIRRAGALVSEHPGTTRDYLVAEVDLDGVRCRLIDTAGTDPGESPQPSRSFDDVDRAARDLALQQGGRADVRIVCIDASRSDPSGGEPSEESPSADIVAWTKADLASPPGAGLPSGVSRVGPTRTAGQASSDALFQRVSGSAHAPWHTLRTSSATCEGIDALRDALRRAVLAMGAGDADVVASTAIRCRESMRLAGESLARASQIAAVGQGDELLAAELRVALEQLGQVVGAIYTDDVLDRIFTRFCIGK